MFKTDLLPHRCPLCLEKWFRNTQDLDFHLREADGVLSPAARRFYIQSALNDTAIRAAREIEEAAG